MHDFCALSEVNEKGQASSAGDESPHSYVLVKLSPKVPNALPLRRGEDFQFGSSTLL